MKLQVTSLASALFFAGCTDQATGGASSPTLSTPTPSPSSGATPTPSPSSSPGPTPSPSPSTEPTYLAFADLYISRLGRDLVLPSACSGLTLDAEPPSARAVSTYGSGLNFRYVLTPQVWSVSGDGVVIGLDGRFTDPLATGFEVAYFQVLDGVTNRFTIARPAPGAGLDYARLASVSTQVAGIGRTYQCVVGVSTLAADLTAAAGGGYPRRIVTATAHVREGATSRAYTLGNSTLAISADMIARRVAITLTLTGTPTGGMGADVALGTLTASAPIDPANGNFVAPLASSDRTVTGTISGRFFGPDAVEIGAAIGGTVAAAGPLPGYTFSGAVFGAR